MAHGWLETKGRYRQDSAFVCLLPSGTITGLADGTAPPMECREIHQEGKPVANEPCERPEDGASVGLAGRDYPVEVHPCWDGEPPYEAP